MYSKNVALSKKQINDLENLAKTKFNGNFSEALRYTLGDKPETFSIARLTHNVQ